MAVSQAIRKAGRVLSQGGVIAYPTEGVFGLGCLPDDAPAVQRVLTIKQREPDKGLVLIASDQQQLNGWIDVPEDCRLVSGGEQKPVTWIVPAADDVSPLVRGNHSGIAVRLTAHPVAKALCDVVDSPLVSTSANLSGRPHAPHALSSATRSPKPTMPSPSWSNGPHGRPRTESRTACGF